MACHFDDARMEVCVNHGRGAEGRSMGRSRSLSNYCNYTASWRKPLPRTLAPSKYALPSKDSGLHDICREQSVVATTMQSDGYGEIPKQEEIGVSSPCWAVIGREPQNRNGAFLTIASSQQAKWGGPKNNRGTTAAERLGVRRSVEGQLRQRADAGAHVV